MMTHILLIDDDVDDRELFSEALRAVSPGTMFHTATDGFRAFLKLDNGEIKKPDLIFLDINMPVMNGWQCLEALKKHPVYGEIPVIMYSTSSFPEEIGKACRLGALCFFSKPSDFEQLKKDLETVVRHLKFGRLDTLETSSPAFMRN